MKRKLTTRVVWFFRGNSKGDDLPTKSWWLATAGCHQIPRGSSFLGPRLSFSSLDATNLFVCRKASRTEIHNSWSIIGYQSSFTSCESYGNTELIDRNSQRILRLHPIWGFERFQWAPWHPWSNFTGWPLLRSLAIFSSLRQICKEVALASIGSIGIWGKHPPFPSQLSTLSFWMENSDCSAPVSR